LEANGVLLMICQLRLKHNEVVDQLGGGILGGMPDIIDTQSCAAKVYPHKIRKGFVRKLDP
jgi:hypothetical protein